jgi:hypothetical protein
MSAPLSVIGRVATLAGVSFLSTLSAALGIFGAIAIAGIFARSVEKAFRRFSKGKTFLSR